MGREGKEVTVRSEDAEVKTEDPVSRMEVRQEVVLVELHGGADGAEEPGGPEARSEDRDVKSTSPKVRVVLYKGLTRDKTVELAAGGSRRRRRIEETPGMICTSLDDGVRRCRHKGVGQGVPDARDAAAFDDQVFASNGGGETPGGPNVKTSGDFVLEGIKESVMVRRPNHNTEKPERRLREVDFRSIPPSGEDGGPVAMGAQQ